jgi:hypothetical protein
MPADGIARDLLAELMLDGRSIASAIRGSPQALLVRAQSAATCLATRPLAA